MISSIVVLYIRLITSFVLFLDWSSDNCWTGKWCLTYNCEDNRTVHNKVSMDTVIGVVVESPLRAIRFDGVTVLSVKSNQNY